MPESARQNSDDLERIGKTFVEVNNYLNNIYEPLQIVKSTFNKSSFSNISFNNPYAIQFDTTFSFGKEDIDFLHKDITEIDKQRLIEILNKKYGIDSNTKYPVKIKYCDLIKLLKQLANDEKISGFCLKKYLILLSSKITAKKAHRGKISSAVNKTTFAVGLVSVAITLFGFIASFSVVGFIGLCIMIFFTGSTVASRAVNTSNEITKQNNANEIKSASDEIGNIHSKIESKISDSLKYKPKQQNKKEQNKKDDQKKIDKNASPTDNLNIANNRSKKPVAKNSEKKSVSSSFDEKIDNNKDEGKNDDVIKNYVINNKKENDNNQQILREIIKTGENDVRPVSLVSDQNSQQVENKNDVVKKEENKKNDNFIKTKNSNDKEKDSQKKKDINQISDINNLETINKEKITTIENIDDVKNKNSEKQETKVEEKSNVKNVVEDSLLKLNAGIGKKN